MTATLHRAELAGDAPRQSWASRVWRGRRDRPAWERPALLVLLGLTGLLYLWNLSASGYANSFYAAAVQAGTKSWKAFLFGSSDSSNFITVDKPPASLWVMEISGRVFGFTSWSMLVPQALEGVATVGVLYAAVRRWFSAPAALLAGSVAALTPVAVLMFKFNNPDALLVLLVTLSAYALLRAVESGRTGWLLLVGGLLGTGFLTKSLQAFLVVPVLGLVYLVCGPRGLGRRVLQVLAGFASLVVFSGWWVLLTIAVPAADRPYIGGSQNNTVLNLVFGYNGFGRLTGNENGSVVGGGGQGRSGQWGPTGLGRLFNSSYGGQASWLIPAALVLLVVGLALTARRPRTDLARASLLVWGVGLLVTGLTFTVATGIIHPYYTVALVPFVGGTVGVGAHLLWIRRASLLARLGLGAALVATGGWSYVLLHRTVDWMPWLAVGVAGMTLLAAVLIVGLPRLTGRFAVLVAGIGVVGALAGSAAYAVDTTRVAHTGSIPSAGPAGQGSAFGGAGPGGFPGGGAGNAARRGRAAPGSSGGPGAPGGLHGPGGGFGASRQGGGFPPAGGTAGGRGGGALLNASASNPTLTAALQAGSYTWSAAAIGSDTAAGYQLASGRAVMAIGGFNGTDPAPSLAQFEAYVRGHQIHYFITNGGGFGGAGGGTTGVSADITSWVEAHFAASSLGGTTVYDLTVPQITTGS